MVKLMHGDCLKLMKEIEPGSVDLILTDPPYGITSRNPWDKVLDFNMMWEGIHHVSRQNTPVLLFGQMPFGSDLIQSNRREYRYEWIWKKPMPLGFLNANKMPLRAHENIMVFYRSLPLYNPQFWKALTAHTRGGYGSSTNYGKNRPIPLTEPTKERYPVDVITFSNADNRNKQHPTEKPVDLLEYLIRTYSNEDDTVLDFCMGSGSTGIACINTNRNFIGIELDDHYFDVAQKRIFDHFEKERNSNGDHNQSD